ncbi:MAG: S49 family peptidase [Simkaniaceae bacterium]|nr:S49 family peptidase [Simkaniaceae bacterium]
MKRERESIFVSAFRTLCKTVAVILGVMIVLVVGAVVLGSFLPIAGGRDADHTKLVIAADAEGDKAALPSSAPVLLRINIHGPIGSKSFNSRLVDAQLSDSRKGILKGERVKGILLHIDSPGGTVADSFGIYTSLKRYKEKYGIPVHAYVSRLCASGGMYVACSADRIVSSPIAVTGSVGVRMGPCFNVSKLMKVVGIEQTTLTEGMHKDTLNPFRPWTSDETDDIRAVLAYDYEMFVNIVAANRPHIDKAALVDTYGAKVFDAVTAQRFGYVDASDASYGSALTDLAKVAEIEGKYQVVELQNVRPFLADLVEGASSLLSGRIRHEIAGLSPEGTDLLPGPLYLYSP